MGVTWTPERIQRLRQAIDETTETFGARFGVSGRTVESWELRTESGRAPHPSVLMAMDALAKRRKLTV